jgi:hypothetical protein
LEGPGEGEERVSVVPVILHSSFNLHPSLRSETALPIKGIAARVQIGRAKGAKSVLPHLAQSQTNAKPQEPSYLAPSSNSNLRFDKH